MPQTTGKTNGRRQLDPPFFFEGDSLCWLLEGVEVDTLGEMTSTLSVGNIGLREHMVPTDGGRSTGVTLAGVRGSGLTMVRSGGEPFTVCVSLCMASELRMTRKWVLSDGVMVTVFSGSSFSFLLTWTSSIGWLRWYRSDTRVLQSWEKFLLWLFPETLPRSTACEIRLEANFQRAGPLARSRSLGKKPETSHG